MLINAVAPFAGAWIEIMGDLCKATIKEVAPFAGAWIEIYDIEPVIGDVKSLPSRERGLKLNLFLYKFSYFFVAPFAGAWIEINKWTRR